MAFVGAMAMVGGGEQVPSLGDGCPTGCHSACAPRMCLYTLLCVTQGDRRRLQLPAGVVLLHPHHP